MKQANQEKRRKGLDLLEELKAIRGRDVLEFHKRIANDPDLLRVFAQNYDICYKKTTHLPPKYKELIMVAIGCALKSQGIINSHAKMAIENGATIEEFGEILQLVFFLSGVANLLPAEEIFEPLEL
jgi:alkylhydroperoxidase/carboxymuconolactone decarboxylase family protein YurZ